MPIHDAICIAKNNKMVEMLVQAGADVNRVLHSQGKNGELQEKMPLALAISTGDSTLVELLLEHGADATAPRMYRDSRGESRIFPLYDCLEKTDNLKILELLISYGADVNAVTQQYSDDHVYIEQTALSRALGEKRMEIVQLLLEKGADVNAKRLWKKGEKPSYYAPVSDCIWKIHSPQMLKLLGQYHPCLTKTAAYHTVETFEEQDAIHEAVLEESLEMTQILLDLGADPNGVRLYQDQNGTSYFTALGDSIHQISDIEVMKLLLKAGADTALCSREYLDGGLYNEIPPLTQAIMDEKYDTVQYLLEHGANVNGERLHRGANGTVFYSALSECIWNIKNAEYVELLLKHGADATRVEKDYDTDGDETECCMLYNAVMYGTPEMIPLLIKYGASMKNRVTIKGETWKMKKYPFGYHETISPILRKYGWKG